MRQENFLDHKSSRAVGSMLGAAYGDALGWPNERISKQRKQSADNIHPRETRSWKRKAGGRFNPYEEIIEQGSYSDDTQLVICLSRSLLKGEDWWNHFVRVELPFWICYERGGGRATKEAARSWLNGIEPWNSKRKSKELEEYFNAGGNGVAMRILPHVIMGIEKDFSEISGNIFLDGISTHGHPRALIGALAYGYVLWWAIRRESNLQYGQILGELLANVETWSKLPDFGSMQADWINQCRKFNSNLEEVWEKTAEETVNYLQICQTELARGSISFENSVLDKIGCFDKKVNGAGTIAAVASSYLASKYAADPINGVVSAAFSFGADTDTIASMTGGLLGCINGTDWLVDVKRIVQDQFFLENIAERLASQNMCKATTISVLGAKNLMHWKESLFAEKEKDNISLPDGRVAQLRKSWNTFSRSNKKVIRYVELVSGDQQTYTVTQIKENNSKDEMPLIDGLDSNCSKSVGVKKVNVKLPVSEFEKSVEFYEKCLGLKKIKERPKTIVFDENIILVKEEYTDAIKNFKDNKALLCIEVENIERAYENTKSFGYVIVNKIDNWKNIPDFRFFRVQDSDGNVVEVISSGKN